MKYFILQDDQTKGPYTLNQLRTMWNSGSITGETLYTQEDYSEWVPLDRIINDLEPPGATANEISQPTQLQPQTVEVKSCPYCGSCGIGKVRGLQGINETVMFAFLFFLFIIPGFVYYIYIESIPYCSTCGRRVLK